MIYDCFTFFNELDVLEIRLNTLHNVVDRFVIVEATKTHSNLPKPLYFQENIARFAKFKDKIIHIVVDSYPEYENSWTYENYQRNCISESLSGCAGEDLIILSDVDEIPRPEMVLKNYSSDTVTCLLQDMYFFFVNYVDMKHLVWKGGTKIFKYNVIKNNIIDERHVFYNDDTFPKKLNHGPTLTKLRLYSKLKYAENGGWHFSYMGGVKAVREKLKSFSHQELNNQKMLDEKRLAHYVKSGRDIFGRPGHKFGVVGNQDSLPRFVSENKRKYSHLFFKEDLHVNICKRKVVESKVFIFKKMLQLMWRSYMCTGSNSMRDL